MKFNSKTRSVSHLINMVSFGVALLAGSCSVNAPAESADEDGKDTIVSGMESSRNGHKGSVIFILSPDGILLRKIIYTEVGRVANACQRYPVYANNIKGYPTADTIIGDFNGDGNPEKAWFKAGKSNACNDCLEHIDKKSCRGIIRFSDNRIRALVIDYCPMWIFQNEGDINCDGKDEIGVLPGWFTSDCRNYHLFTYKQGRWIESCPPISITLNMREAGIVPVEKDTARQGYAIVRESMLGYLDNNPNHKIPPEYTNLSSCSAGNVVELHVKLK